MTFPDIRPVLKKLVDIVPTMTGFTRDKVIFKFPTGFVTLAELKTAQPSISNSETRLLSRMFKERLKPSTKNWLVDSVLSAFMMEITNIQPGTFITMTAAVSAFLFSGKEVTTLFTKFNKKTNTNEELYNWNNVEKVLIPYNVQKIHWILLVLDPRKKQVRGRF